ncbi:hypothetical protein CHS0354_039754 [Potamilus streckersoni]|uniref:Uncharacterized protein n=1 Tax=Potamilus streckersoni TaxID=2493646 RepID=A0AAE0RZW1_9BIVA|nr:hypothetical protein CHS0354_039754 [Potamilus streckersoni]
MSSGGTSAFKKLVIVLLVFCFILDLVGFVIPYWYYTESTLLGITVKSYGGLWTVCSEVSLLLTCGDYVSSTLVDWFRAVRAFSALGFLLFLASLVVVIAHTCSKSKKKLIYLVGVCLTFVGAICAMISFAIYAGNATGNLSKFHAAFYITIVAFVLGLVTGILGILDALGVIGGKVGSAS